ncbi:MAG: Flagellar assembly protein FliH/Type secretion system HrpE, partial [Thermoleophilia bacterium]|nr:Flagellar assembly protein FliH/Type secretion system HrpE [Thermoleophilia bacterium]
MAFSEHAYGGHDAAESSRQRSMRRTFDATSFPSRGALMPDPQQAELSEEARVVDRGARVSTVMVEAPVFPQIDRVRPVSHGAPIAQAPAPLDPAEEARRVVAEARATARTMLAQARQVVEQERATALRQGFAEGYAKGVAEADAETAGLVATCEKIGVHVMQERERVLDENEADIVQLAMAIAKRIVNASIELDETLVVEACRGAMRKAFQRGSMQVLAHPGDLELLRAAGPQLAAELGG